MSSEITEILAQILHGNHNKALILLDQSDLKANDIQHFFDKLPNNVSEEIVKKLIIKGGDINKNNDRGTSPLTHALIYNKLELAKIFIKNGADINIINSARENLLHWLPDNVDEEFMQLLKQYNFGIAAKINIENSHHANPVKIADETGRYATAKLLRQYGGIYNAPIKTKPPLTDEQKDNTLSVVPNF